ncbi:hypothetical protein [Musicola paradisiaca]|uniref:Uncharacterized protein n=1 Tax=Musicola paradisiaca (strain Ech703) TaxID=579405 RepID=C6C939_MUSP7|nr:hypothetical protein [Musicola paradisiaca]ACS86239.1 conserved hypothetical protein [Musicola paradisiaca Ech703]
MFEDDIYPLLRQLADGRVYAYVAPCSVYHLPLEMRRFLIFSLQQETTYDTLQQVKNNRVVVSVDCYAHTVPSARALREQVEVALSSLSPFKHVQYNEFDIEYELFCMTLECHVGL